MTKNYDVLVIPTGETSFRDRNIFLDKMTEEQKREILTDENFPVSSRAAELFKKGNIGHIFVTGGHYGFSNGMRFITTSEARETVEYLTLIKGIDRKYITDDNRSLDTLGNFAFPIAFPQENKGKVNKNLDTDFKTMQIICQGGHRERIEDCVRRVMPHKREDYYIVLGNHNDSALTRKYHEIFMHLLDKRYGNKIDATKAAHFLLNEHPFYSPGWDTLPLWKRKAIMGKKVFWDWNRELKG